MVEMMIFSRRAQELLDVKQVSKDLAARLTEENWRFHCFQKTEEVREFLDGHLPLDLVCADITGKEGIPLAMECRRENRNAYLILIADAKMSPASYMRPGIMAGSLLLRPFERDTLWQSFSEAFQALFQREEPEERGQLVVDNREGTWRIDHERIYYLEAREKKLFLNLGNREIGFYGTIENLQSRLPAYFIRCHRSFLVNGRMIEKFMPGRNLVVLRSGWEIPVSRSYKKEVREYVG